MKKRALILLHPGFEEMEAVAPIDLLARAEVEVVQASTSDTTLVEGRNGITLQANCLFSEIADQNFDAIILPGGPGVQKLRGDNSLIECLRRHKDAGRLIAAICAAPLLLLDAGLLSEASQPAYTAHPSTQAELPDALEKAVVSDQSILSSRGAGTATEFALALVRQLCGDASAKEIAQSICWSHYF
jgi:4-methyl-5(b-hydroxyethyl)-thiazole monophosphate biosynthesis